MTKNRKYLMTVLSTALIASPLVASAEDNWYIAPGVNYVIADGDRNADDDLGLKLGLGKQLNEKWDIEASLVMDKLDFSNGSGDYDQKGLMVDGLYFLNRNANFKPYLIMGAGLLQTDIGSSSNTNLALNVGVGMERRVTDSGVALRGDIRYRLDNDDNSVAGKSRFGDWIVGLSVKVPFGAKSSKPVAAAAVAAVAVVTKPKPKAVVKDGDADGVIDSKDKCPKSVKNASVDSSGCEVIILRGVNFETNSAKITSASTPILDAAAATLKQRGDIKVEVAGHTDSQGAAAYNQTLSASRANAVRKYLVNKGVNAGNLSAKGYGSSVAIADNKTSFGRAANRRVELRVQK